MLSDRHLNHQWTEFLMDFAKVNTCYRQGAFEIKLNSETSILDSSIDGEDLQIIQIGEGLQPKAHELYEIAKAAWEENRVPFDYFKQFLRAMTISFEIDEYFLCLSIDKKQFFNDFTNDFLRLGENATEGEIIAEIQKYSAHITNFPKTNNEEFLISLGYELVLFCCSGLNVKYVAHSLKGYEEGLAASRTLLKYIDKIIKYKQRHSASGKQIKYGLGLLALTYYFRARFAFGFGKFNKARKWFKKSRQLYLKKMYLLIDSADETQIEAQKLALRRACLVDVIGLGNLYLIESRIDKAIRILKAASPLLELSTGDVMKSYCDLLTISVMRAKYSSNRPKLDKLEQQAEQCLHTFEKHVGYSHFPHKAGIELALLNMYKAKSLKREDLSGRKSFCEKALNYLTRAIVYAEQKTLGEELKNGRLLIESLTLRSHLYRSYADFQEENFQMYIELAIQDAERAQNVALGLKQLESDALIALGIAYRDLFFKAAPRSEKEAEYKRKSRKYFTDALIQNSDGNYRLLAVCYLRMTELEMLKTTNFARAKFLFKSYTQIKHKVGHSYVIKFGKELKQILQQFSHNKMFDFYLDPQESLNLSDWHGSLREFLIKQAVFVAAINIKGKLPNLRRKGEPAISDGQATVMANFKDKSSGLEFMKPLIGKEKPKVAGKNATRQSILADFLMENVGLKRGDAYDEAGEHLEEFEQWCEIIRYVSSA